MNTKRRRRFTIPFALLVGLFAGAGALAQDAPAEIEGEVVRIMQQTRAGEPGGVDAVMVRTRQGEQRRLLLGASGGCDGCVRVGDQVRARLSKNGASADGYRVRSMRVERTGRKLRFRDASGELLRARSRDGSGDAAALGDRTRRRDRIDQPADGSRGAGGRGSGGGKGGGRR